MASHNAYNPMTGPNMTSVPRECQNSVIEHDSVSHTTKGESKSPTAYHRIPHMRSGGERWSHRDVACEIDDKTSELRNMATDHARGPVDSANSALNSHVEDGNTHRYPNSRMLTK